MSPERQREEQGFPRASNNQKATPPLLLLSLKDDEKQDPLNSREYYTCRGQPLIAAEPPHAHIYRGQPLVGTEPLHAQAPASVDQRVGRVGNVAVRAGEVDPRRLERVPAAEGHHQVVHKALPAGAPAAWHCERPLEDTPILGLHVGTLRVPQ